jgi:competence protein ComEC
MKGVAQIRKFSIWVSRIPARLPLLGMVVGCFLGVLCAEAQWTSVGLIALLLPLVLAVRFRAWKTVLLLGAWMALWALHGGRLQEQEKLASSLREGSSGVTTLAGVVTRRLDRDGFLPGAWMQIEEGPWQGALVGLRRIPKSLRPGDRVRVKGDLSLPPVARNPGEMDFSQWMRVVGLAGELEVQDLAVLDPPAWQYALTRWSWAWRGRVGELVTAGVPPNSREALLIRALVLGDRSQGGDKLYGVFRRTGTMHVFAVSGLHVGLVGLLGWLLMRAFCIPRSTGLWVVVALIWSYALVTGLRPPAFRAATMGTFVLLGFVLRRQSSVGNALLASVPVVLMMDSFQWRLPGFQLSYVVVAVIVLLGSWVLQMVQPWIEGDAFLPRVLYTKRQEWERMLRMKFGGLGAVSGAAWLGSFPLMRFYFGVVTPMAVPASMLLVPVAFVILSLALVGMLTGLVVPQIGGGVNRANAMLVGGSYRVVQALSSVPGGQFRFRSQSWGEDGILVFALAGGGAASHLDAGGGVLIDVGSEREFYRVVRPALREGQFFPDTMVLTHPDGAHVGGAIPAMEEWPVKQLLVPTDWARSPSYRALMEQGEEVRGKFVSAQVGQVYPLEEGVWLEVLHAPRGREDRVADERGIVSRLHWHGWRILFTGDAGFVTEKELVARGIDVAADVWVMGRHDSDFTGTTEFVRAVGPQVIVTSDSGFAESQRVPKQWAEKISEAGIELWRLGRTGAVEIVPSEKELVLRSFLQPEERRRLKRAGDQ